jgi:hypothetical protein
MEEVWKEIKGYEGKYEISNLGRIKSLFMYRYKLDGNYKVFRELIITPKRATNGYLGVDLSLNGKIRHSIHRLVAINFIENPYDYKEVNHIDGDKENNKVDNLEWMSLQQNRDHAKVNKLMEYGEGRYNSKLDDNKIRVIREEFGNGLTMYKLAKKFEVCSGTIKQIIDGKSWKHVK